MFSDRQLEDLRELQDLAIHFGTGFVIIGASALLCFIDDIGSFTADVDIVIALDLEDFAAFSSHLLEAKWIQERRREHRWKGPRGSLVDIVPAGTKLRAAKQIIWPESQFVMSLVAFDHVFTSALSIQFAPKVKFKVAPPPVIALLKIVAYMEDPYRRAKDLLHLKSMFRSYEAKGDRLYCDEVFAAGLDFQSANAFLLGLDIGQLATADDRYIVRAFLDKHLDPYADELNAYDDMQEFKFQAQLQAFEKGITPVAARNLA